jgi:dTDP-4-amino-4,6-dideoxygalactose transaminase
MTQAPDQGKMSVPRPVPVTVPMVDLGLQSCELHREVMQALEQVVRSGVYVLGPRVAAFEKAFSEYTGSKHCVGVNSGTSALHLALICAGVGPGDEVITVPMTFVSTAWSVSYLGATPVFVDVDPTGYTMDPRKVEARITPRTKAILPVHLYGQPAALEPLLEIGQRHGIPVIEDAAQAHGARYFGRHVGTLGRCGCFSFYPSKNLGAYGEAGAIITDDGDIAARLRSLRDHAQNRRHHHDEVGFNYRMDAIQGAVLGIKLEHLERWQAERRRQAERYRQLLDGFPIRLPVAVAGHDQGWHLFVVLHPRRDRIRGELQARGIQTGLHYPVPLHLQNAYGHLGHRSGDFPVAERIARECLSLPLFPGMTTEQQDMVVQALKDALCAVD